MGEGGAIVINREKYMERAEIIREKRTNRRQVLKGCVDKYTWHDIESSFLPSDLLAAKIISKRMKVLNLYHEELADLEKKSKLLRQFVPENVEHNVHVYNILLLSDEIRAKLVVGLKEQEIMAYICYVPLHSAHGFEAWL
jgi:dTDP-4-amino-4,6-dideoxygalactose transaminase